MTRRVLLHSVATARAGDKGDISSVAVFADGPAIFADLRAQLTPERLKAEFPRRFLGRVRRYEIPHLHTLNFVLEDGLEGGVNASLNLDAHGKSLSYLLLGLSVDLSAPAVAEAGLTGD